MKIDVLNLSKEFKNNKVLQSINVEFNEGKIYGLIGKNGSGKSVFLKVLCGFYKPTSGKVLVDGRDISEEGIFLPEARALIEHPNFISDLTGYENLLLLANIQNKIGKEEIEKSLKEVNLYQEKNKVYSSYSLGMKQKLGIAQVIMENPKIMIFDEPFNGIENDTVEKISKKLLELKKQGKIIILTSHHNEEISKLADEIYKFENGKIQSIKKLD